MRKCYDKVQKMGQETLLFCVQPAVQFILNLRDPSADFRSLVELTGEIINEPEYFERAKTSNYSPVLVAGAYAMKMQLVTYFGFFGVGETVISEMAPYAQTLRYSCGVIPYYFTTSHTYFELSRLYGKRHYIKKARKFKRMIERIVALDYPTAAAFFSFLTAMELSLKKSTSDAHLERAYDKAIAALSDASKQYEGLANEQAGFSFVRRGLRRRLSSTFIKQWQCMVTNGVQLPSVSNCGKRAFLLWPRYLDRIRITHEWLEKRLFVIRDQFYRISRCFHPPRLLPCLNLQPFKKSILTGKFQVSCFSRGSRYCTISRSCLYILGRVVVRTSCQL